MSCLLLFVKTIIRYLYYKGMKTEVHLHHAILSQFLCLNFLATVVEWDAVTHHHHHHHNWLLQLVQTNVTVGFINLLINGKAGLARVHLFRDILWSWIGPFCFLVITVPVHHSYWLRWRSVPAFTFMDVMATFCAICLYKPRLLNLLTLTVKMVVACFSESLLSTYKLAWYHNSENQSLKNHFHENLKWSVSFTNWCASLTIVFD